ncbi:sialate O-acetylesterase [Hymenobacter armeniacus]|uniref:Sialate O-acetylesterase n=1 Tax=Hymenobacter armeniacus TaxID=2771358 RepID=A0ABR8JTK5_9BACT|nr:sialate O-acetylesterase [Hymenobacter armeniacus]MBD2721862.1 sialate O-acetylesterase [Hymenobacter armeniacus]
MNSCRLPLLYFLLVALLPTTGLRAQALKPRLRQAATPPARKEKFRLYLLIGQSNMAGRGLVEAEDTVPNARVLRLNPAGQWEVAQDPLHFDKAIAGVGPGLSFGRLMAAQDPGLTIGLIPCAVGGSGIDAWVPGAYFEGTKTHPYDDALARARTALRTGTLAGIIWHQGETDSTPEKSAAYEQKLQALIAQLRADLRAPGVPFVAGQLPAFQINKAGPDGQPHPNEAARRVNQAVAALAAQVANYAYIGAEGTADIGDHTHFNAASARLLGRRYAAAMQALHRHPSRKN